MKKLFAVFVLALIGLLAMVGLQGCGVKKPTALESAGAMSTMASTDSTVNLILDSPKTMEEVGHFAREHQLEVLEVRFQRPGYVVGFRLDGQDPVTMAKVFSEEHRKYLMLLRSRTEPDLSSQRAAAISELMTLNAITLRVSSVTIEGLASQVKNLAGVTMSVQPLSADNPGPSVNPSSIRRVVEPNSVNHPSQMWAPYGGTSEVNKSYSYQRFIFNDVSKLGSSLAAYEHETLISDKNYADQTGYWASNLPNPYLDCGNTDSVDNFAVGSFTANQIRTYTWYYTYIGLVGQSSPSSLVKIWAERGTNWTWSCWTVTSNEHAGLLVTHYAGGGISWQF